jgi:hypothetical protein
MNDLIETLDRKRRRYLLGYLIGFVAFFIVWLARFFLRETGLLSDRMHSLVVVFLWITIPVQGFFAVGLNRIKSAIKKDPQLCEALHDELLRQHEIRAWRYATIAMAICLAIFFVVNTFLLPIKDLNAVILTTLFAGAAGYQLSFYFMNRD